MIYYCVVIIDGGEVEFGWQCVQCDFFRCDFQ